MRRGGFLLMLQDTSWSFSMIGRRLVASDEFLLRHSILSDIVGSVVPETSSEAVQLYCNSRVYRAALEQTAGYDVDKTCQRRCARAFRYGMLLLTSDKQVQLRDALLLTRTAPSIGRRYVAYACSLGVACWAQL